MKEKNPKEFPIIYDIVLDKNGVHYVHYFYEPKNLYVYVAKQDLDQNPEVKGMSCQGCNYKISKCYAAVQFLK